MDRGVHRRETRCLSRRTAAVAPAPLYCKLTPLLPTTLDRMLRIGIIGLGPDWDDVYRPALARLSGRLRVTAVYDAVEPRAAWAGEGLRAPRLTGIRAMLHRADVAAVLWLDRAWHGLAPLELAIEQGKPVYVGVPLSGTLPKMETLCRAADSKSVLVSPELRLRTAPTTTRIHELAATRLGAVEEIDARIRCDVSGCDLRDIVSAVDWCSSLVRSVPVDCRVECLAGGALDVHLTFRRVRSDSTPTAARIRLEPRPDSPKLAADVTCLQGRIEVTSETELRWQTAEQTTGEQLDRDRNGVEVLLDHFARRVVGGLVPVAGLDDVCRILRLLEPYDALLKAGNKS